MKLTELSLLNGETLLYSGTANKWQTVGSKGGKLFLTNRRIVFQAHTLNIGSQYDSYELCDIQTNENTINIKTSSNLLSFNITFYTKGGEKLSFVVTRRQKDEWIQQITKALTLSVQANTSVPDGIRPEQEQSIKSQIKVVQCGGCGAFVVITAGAVTKCEYCGRPHTIE